SGRHVLYLVADSQSLITGAVANVNYFALQFVSNCGGGGTNHNKRYGIVTSILGACESSKSHELGVGWVRVEMPWKYLETSQDQWNYNYGNDVLNQARAHGLKIYATLGNPPPWRQRDSTTRYPNDLNQ